jgi:hypothetical protein
MVHTASTSIQASHDELSYRSVTITRIDAVPVDIKSELFAPTDTQFALPPFIDRIEDKLAVWHLLYDRMTTPDQLDKVVSEIFQPFFHTIFHTSAVESALHIREQFRSIRETDQLHDATGHNLLQPPRHELDSIQISLSSLH